MDKFRDRLRLAAAHAGVEYSQTAIAEALGVKKQTVDYWLSSEGDPRPRPHLIYRIAELWMVDAQWLATSQGDMIPKPIGLSATEKNIVLTYRKASPQKRQMIEAVLKAMGKAIVVATLAIQAFVPTKAEAAFNITLFNGLHIVRRWFAFLTNSVSFRTG